MKKSQPFLLSILSVLIFVVITGCMSMNIGDKGAIRGRVFGDNGPLQGVRVEAGDQVAFTNDAGDFLLENVSSGAQYVFFSFEGYTGALVKVTVVKGNEVPISSDGSVTLSLSSDNNDYEYLVSIYQLGFYEKSFLDSEKYIKEFTGSNLIPNVLFIKGASAYYLGDYQTSLSILKDMVKSYPDNEFADDGQYLLARCLGQGLNQWWDSINEYKNLIQNYPQSEFVGVAYYEMGDCYYILESYSNASVAYDQARVFGGEIEKKSIYGLAHCFYKLELFYKAASLFAEYVQKYPNDEFADDAQYFEGASWYRRDDYQQALEAFDKSIVQYPTGTWYNGILIAPASMFNKGLCLEKLGRYSEAYQVYLDIIRKYPGAKWADGTSLISNAQYRIELLKDAVL
ncbi:MAG: tetratricopeptide repeat protein [Atribacterota bacterium]|jgi:TolA-binding protein|uniref:tetratricopeptide repeat protein n=1 Tax=Atribacter sp. TaxID=2847780 RepID=UPI00176A53E6|nr:tetratricopeptide repeat protein [Atribacterota bacterium]HHT10493.1 tetratricopeptide repeat protein [Candidatus Atribacteria bacterium]